MLFLVAAVMAAFCYGNPAPLDEQSATWDWARNETTLDGLLNLMPFPKHVHWPKPAFRRVSGSLDMEGTTLGAKQVAHIKRLLHDGVAMARSVPFRVSYDWRDESASGIKLVLSAAIRLVEIPTENDSEAYTLRIEPEENSPQKILVHIDAETSTGVMHGVATLKQLFGWGGNGSRRSDGYACLPIGITITDEPEKQWRGLMVDVARHFRPLENLKSICRGMAEAKLNVMHLRNQISLFYSNVYSSNQSIHYLFRSERRSGLALRDDWELDSSAHCRWKWELLHASFSSRLGFLRRIIRYPCVSGV